MLEGKLLLNKYKIIRKIGCGGMSCVYEAENIEAKMKVAVKILHPEYADDEEILNEFINEAKTLAMLEQHPNIAWALDFGEDSGYYFLVMNYLEESLEDLIKRKHKLSIPEAVAITEDILNALIFAHNKGVLHRDCKPSNIMFDKQGHAVLTDFGIARARSVAYKKTRKLEVFGTLPYMAPERLKEGEVEDERSDIYSVGLILFEMLAGEPLYKGDPHQILYEKLRTKSEDQPELPDITQYIQGLPASLEYIILKAIRKDKNQRYASAEEFLKDLKNYQHVDVFRERLISLKKEIGHVTSSPTQLHSVEERTISKFMKLVRYTKDTVWGNAGIVIEEIRAPLIIPYNKPFEIEVKVKSVSDKAYQNVKLQLDVPDTVKTVQSTAGLHTITNKISTARWRLQIKQYPDEWDVLDIGLHVEPSTIPVVGLRKVKLFVPPRDVEYHEEKKKSHKVSAFIFIMTIFAMFIAGFFSRQFVGRKTVSEASLAPHWCFIKSNLDSVVMEIAGKRFKIKTNEFIPLSKSQYGEQFCIYSPNFDFLLTKGTLSERLDTVEAYCESGVLKLQIFPPSAQRTARIVLKDKIYRIESGGFILPKGDYEVKVYAEGYRDTQFIVKISPDNLTTYELWLERPKTSWSKPLSVPTPATLEIRTKPSYDSVYITVKNKNYKLTGRVPFSRELKRNKEYNITVKYKNAPNRMQPFAQYDFKVYLQNDTVIEVPVYVLKIDTKKLDAALTEIELEYRNRKISLKRETLQQYPQIFMVGGDGMLKLKSYYSYGETFLCESTTVKLEPGENPYPE